MRLPSKDDETTRMSKIGGPGLEQRARHAARARALPGRHRGRARSARRDELGSNDWRRNLRPGRPGPCVRDATCPPYRLIPSRYRRRRPALAARAHICSNRIRRGDRVVRRCCGFLGRNPQRAPSPSGAGNHVGRRSSVPRPVCASMPLSARRGGRALRSGAHRRLFCDEFRTSPGDRQGIMRGVDGSSCGPAPIGFGAAPARPRAI